MLDFEPSNPDSATEPIILLVIIMQTVFLTIQAAPNVDTFPHSLDWGHSWVDYCLLAVFIFYTLYIGLSKSDCSVLNSLQGSSFPDLFSILLLH